MNPATARAPGPHLGAWVLPLVPAAAAAAVFRGALPYFFAQDDFLGLARARGLAPPLAGPWRWLSGQAYFELMRPFGLASATPYHVVSLLAHAAAAALLALVLARRLGAPAALIGATFFAAHPSHYTAVYSVSGIGELLAGLLVLATLWLAELGGRARWLALAAFTTALLCKESVLLLPLFLLIAPARAAPLHAGESSRAGSQPQDARVAWPGRDLVWALAAIMLLFATLLFVSDVFSVRSGLSSRAPYALSFGPHVLANATTYLGWAVQPWLPLARGFQDAVDPAVRPAAAIAALLWAAGLAWTPLRRSAWWTGAALCFWLLLPVLGLRNHTYHYYLYAPLIGIALALAALADVVMRETRIGRDSAFAWATALVAAALLSWNGAAFAHRIETQPFTDPRLRADPLVDRARISRRVTDALASAHLSDGTSLAFWSPWALLEQARASGGVVAGGESYTEANVRAALMDGLAVRVLFPRLGAVSFMHLYRTPPGGSRVALYDADGSLQVFTPAHVDSMLTAHPIPGARP